MSAFHPLRTFGLKWQTARMTQIKQLPDETDEQFYARVDPFDDRLSHELPRWGCFLILAVLLALLIGAYKVLT